jgi:maltokinase
MDRPVTDPGVDENALAAWLGGQRWFAGKGRVWTLTGTQTVAWLYSDQPAVQLLLAMVTYADGETETYQVPLVHHAAPVENLGHAFVCEAIDEADNRTWVYDALHDKDVTRWWMVGVAEQVVTDGARFHRIGTAAIPVEAPSIVIGAEQSNTSLVFGDEAILKVFRKVSPGLNPDIEVHEALDRAGSRHIATPLGWLEGTWTDPSGDRVTGSLAMLQAFLRNGSEGWELAQTSVRDLFAEGDLHADEVGGDFASEAFRLGVATAEVHADLAATLPTGILGSVELAALAAAMRGRLDAAAAEVAALTPYVDDLRAAYDDLARRVEKVRVQRVHGDYHLGQVMRTLQGWQLLDFEGEPAKPLEERRALDSPLRDVAGMLRSFDYAARQLLVDHPGEPHLEYRAHEWSERNRDAFCDGYAEAVGRDPRSDDVLLRAYETDKAVYEVVYEARSRPGWLRIPIEAIARLAAAR